MVRMRIVRILSRHFGKIACLKKSRSIWIFAFVSLKEKKKSTHPFLRRMICREWSHHLFCPHTRLVYPLPHIMHQLNHTKYLKAPPHVTGNNVFHCERKEKKKHHAKNANAPRANILKANVMHKTYAIQTEIEKWNHVKSKKEKKKKTEIHDLWT